MRASCSRCMRSCPASRQERHHRCAAFDVSRRESQALVAPFTDNAPIKRRLSSPGQQIAAPGRLRRSDASPGRACTRPLDDRVAALGRRHENADAELDRPGRSHPPADRCPHDAQPRRPFASSTRECAAVGADACTMCCSSGLSASSGSSSIADARGKRSSAHVAHCLARSFNYLHPRHVGFRRCHRAALRRRCLRISTPAAPTAGAFLGRHLELFERLPMWFAVAVVPGFGEEAKDRALVDGVGDRCRSVYRRARFRMVCGCSPSPGAGTRCRSWSACAGRDHHADGKCGKQLESLLGRRGCMHAHAARRNMRRNAVSTFSSSSSSSR